MTVNIKRSPAGGSGVRACYLGDWCRHRGYIILSVSILLLFWVLCFFGNYSRIGWIRSVLIIIANVSWVLTMGRALFECFACINSSNSYNSLETRYFVSPHFKWGGSEYRQRIAWLKTIQLVSSRIEIESGFRNYSLLAALCTACIPSSVILLKIVPASFTRKLGLVLM